MRNTKIFHIGCQSWQYDDWISKPGEDPIFYPRGTRPPEMLEYYSQIFDTIEVDSTAYGTPAVSTLDGWVAATPDNFRFSLKVPRAITHEFSLTPHSYTLMDEFTDAARLLGKKLGAILIQLPASFESTKDNGAALRGFVSRLPRDMKFALEFRHPGWFVEWTFDELNENGVALGLVAGKWIPEETVFSAFEKTDAPIAYLRMMGLRDLDKFDRIYRDRIREIEQWAARTRELKAEQVFVYLDNYFEGHAPATANRFKAQLGIPITDPQKLDPQASLF
jgi:uncharacterized protein YecE (DUF72 family)